MKSKGIDWDAQPLGEIPDTELARRLGCTHQAVYAQRRRRRIPAAMPWRRSMQDWDNQPLGQMPDRELATLLGVRVSAVANARGRRKIPGFVPTQQERRRPHRDTLELLHHRYQLSTYAIGELLGCDQKLVYKLLREHGLNRSVHEAMASPVTRKRVSDGVLRAHAARRQAAEQWAEEWKEAAE